MDLGALCALPCCACGVRQDLAVWLDLPGRVWLGERLVELICAHCEGRNHAELHRARVVWGRVAAEPRTVFRPLTRSEVVGLEVKGSPAGLTVRLGRREWFLPRRSELTPPL